MRTTGDMTGAGPRRPADLGSRESDLLSVCVKQALQQWRTASEHGSGISLPTLLRRFERLWWDTVRLRTPRTLQLRDAGRQRIAHMVRSADAGVESV